MAEIAVNIIIDKLGPLLVQEIKLLKGARTQIQSIQNELRSIRAYLKDADARAAAEDGESNEGIKNWVTDLRNEAYHIEDVIDEYTLNMAQLPHGSGCVGIIHKITRFIKKLKLQHGIASEVEDIKQSLAEIQHRTQTYNFRSIDPGFPHDSMVSSFFIEDAEVVGIESTRDQLIDLLVSGAPNRSVIAVVGEGGLGKTTLAGKTFNSDAVKKHFDCQAWVPVGKDRPKNDLLRAILVEFYRVTGSATVEVDKMPDMDLIATLREQLKDKCYMVVLDDVWKDDFWEDLKYALPDNDKSSRVMLTTRNKEVAYSVPFVNVHMLEPLPSEKAWELFCKKAFGAGMGCPPELEKLSRDILAKCGGVPLQIVAVGGLLSNKNKVVSEWEKLLQSLGSKLGSDSHLRGCNRVLSEGYHDLPHHLKSCLLYFGLFPESYSIKRGRLIRLWMAEGFIPYSMPLACEQVAEEYLTGLIDRSLVQVSLRNYSERATSVRVHDLMHEIILRKTRELGFSRVLNGHDLSHFCKTRRISVHRNPNSVAESMKVSTIRSICLFNVEKLPESFMTKIVANFNLINVLDFEDAPLDNLPDEVGKLFHLHYLSLRNTKVKELPKSIGLLLNLESLDLKWSLVEELPVEIKNLKKLRFLMVLNLSIEDRNEYRTKILEGIGALMNLQKLCYVHAKSGAIKELEKLKQLRKLGLGLESRDVEDLFAVVGNMEKLRQLNVSVPSRGEEVLDIHSVACPPRCLQRLFLGNRIKKLPNWISELQNLIRLGLHLEALTDDLMAVLQVLPKLLRLHLTVTYCHEQLHIKEGWFPKLKELFLRDFKNLKMMMIEEGAMPNLRVMEIGPSPLMKEIPKGIEHLRNLKILLFNLMLKQVYNMTKDDDWEKVTHHIPQIRVSYKETTKDYFYYTGKYLSSLSSVEDIEQLDNTPAYVQIVLQDSWGSAHLGLGLGMPDAQG